MNVEQGSAALRPVTGPSVTTTEQNNSSKDPAGGAGQAAQPLSRLGPPASRGDEPAADSEVTQTTTSNRDKGVKGPPEQGAPREEQGPSSSGRGAKRQRELPDGGTASPSQGPQELENRFVVMRERQLQLEMALKEKDMELMRLKQAQQMPGPSQSGVQPLITEQELKQAYCSSVQALKDYLVISNLTSYDITGKNLPEKVTADIKTLVHTISKVCLQILKPETPYVLDTISKDYTSTTATDWELDKSHWINVIAQLQLSNLQVLSILHARELHVAKMQVLLQERAGIARQAAELTAAACSTGPGGMLLEDVSNMSVLIQHGYLYFARNALLLQKVVDMFKESLLREQKTVMELFLKVLYQVLSPVQAALFVVEAFPYHCDVLALSNVLALVFGKDGSNAGDMGPAMAGMGPLQNGMTGGDPLDMMMGMGGGMGGSGMGGGGMGGGGMGGGGMGGSSLGNGGMGSAGGLGPGSLANGGLGGGPGSGGCGSNGGTLTPQDAMLLHQHFANGTSGGGASDKLSLMQQPGGQQGLGGGGMASGLGGGLVGGGMGGSLGSGMGGGMNGAMGGGPNSGGSQRLNPFGAMAEMQSMMGGTGSGPGPGGPLDVSGMRGADSGPGGPGGMSAAAVKQELQSLQAAAMARQAAGQMGGGGLSGGMSGDLGGPKGGANGGLGVFSQQHNMSSNLSGMSQSAGRVDNGVGPSGMPSGAGGALSPDLLGGPSPSMGGPGSKGMSMVGGPASALGGGGPMGMGGGLSGAGSLGGGLMGGGGGLGGGGLGGGSLGGGGMAGGGGLFGKGGPGPQGGGPALNLNMHCGLGGMGGGPGGGLGGMMGGHPDMLMGPQGSGGLPMGPIGRYNGPGRGGGLLDVGPRGPGLPGAYSR